MLHRLVVLLTTAGPRSHSTAVAAATVRLAAARWFVSTSAVHSSSSTGARVAAAPSPFCTSIPVWLEHFALRGSCIQKSPLAMAAATQHALPTACCTHPEDAAGGGAAADALNAVKQQQQQQQQQLPVLSFQQPGQQLLQQVLHRQPQPQDAAWTLEEQRFMRLAFEQARAALKVREIPIGCVIVRDGQVIATGYNMTNHTRNATRHAEFEAIDRVLADHGGDMARAGFDRCHLYVTIEPCIMCAGALSLLGFGQVIFGAGNEKFGGCGSIISVNDSTCGCCSGSAPAQPPHGKAFTARGGLFAEEAVQLLQMFYFAGNPLAPKPKRTVLEVPPWELEGRCSPVKPAAGQQQQHDIHHQQQQPQQQQHHHQSDPPPQFVPAVRQMGPAAAAGGVVAAAAAAAAGNGVAAFSCEATALNDMPAAAVSGLS